MPPEPVGREFNDVLLQSIEGTLTTLLSREVVKALYSYLQAAHAISRAEVPYRLDTLSSVLEQTFGGPSSATICRAIARKFYATLDLTFSDNSGRSLVEYVETAKINLAQRKRHSAGDKERI